MPALGPGILVGFALGMAGLGDLLGDVFFEKHALSPIDWDKPFFVIGKVLLILTVFGFFFVYPEPRYLNMKMNENGSLVPHQSHKFMTIPSYKKMLLHDFKHLPFY